MIFLTKSLKMKDASSLYSRLSATAWFQLWDRSLKKWISWLRSSFFSRSKDVLRRIKFSLKEPLPKEVDPHHSKRALIFDRIFSIKSPMSPLWSSGGSSGGPPLLDRFLCVPSAR